MEQTTLPKYVKAMRKQYNLTQVELSEKSGVGLRFVRELEQGKQTLRLDKVCRRHRRKAPRAKPEYKNGNGATAKKRLREESLSFFLWCHQGLMYPCKHLYLNALPLASIKKPRDWHV